MKPLKENWLGYLIVFLLSTASSFVLYAAQTNREDTKTVDTKIELKADKTELKELRVYTDTQDAMLDANLEKHKKEDDAKINLILVNLQDIKATQQTILNKIIK